MRPLLLPALCALTLPLAAAVTLRPDYSNLTVPPNIAPLNFNVEGAPDDARVHISNGTLSRTFPAKVRIPQDFWRELLKAGSYTVTVTSNQKQLYTTVNRVDTEPIDVTLTYRLIPPSYENFKSLGIWWRDLTTFEERPVYSNLQSRTNQCVNCHTFNQADPGTFLFHLRADNPGTVIFRGKDGTAIKRNFKVPPFFASGVYPAWHPSSDFIVFSVNDTFQSFYYSNPDKIEVLDARSDMMLYDLRTDTASPIELSPQIFDCFPTWSPDGKTLYSVAAEPGFDVIPEDKEARNRQAIGAYTNLCYNLIARDFDPAAKTFTQPKMILNASSEKRSITLPRVSPDGRWLVFTLGPRGVFHIWHKASDLWILDLQQRTFRALTEINSPDVESYHTFSSTGKWMVFSSRRDDGAYTRPYFTRFDPAAGTFSKPFILPQEDPDHHLRRMESYNIPEFAAGPFPYTPRQIRRIAAQPALDVKTE